MPTTASQVTLRQDCLHSNLHMTFDPSDGITSVKQILMPLPRTRLVTLGFVSAQRGIKQTSNLGPLSFSPLARRRALSRPPLRIVTVAFA